MIFVQINYRVGAFGFLASENVRKSGDLNVGLLDQQKALKWARQNIHLVSTIPSLKTVLKYGLPMISLTL